MSDRLASRGVWSRMRAVLLALVLIGMVTLMPFRFGMEPMQPFDLSLLASRTALEFGGNILLFAVLGHALVGLAPRAAARHRWWWWAGAVGIGAVLSLGIELTQRALPRNPGLSDVISNVLGTGLGAQLRLWPDRRPMRWGRVAVVGLRRQLTRRVAVVATVVGLPVIGLVGWFGFRTASLSTWRIDMPLVIGDEVGGGRAFRGSIGAIELIAGELRGGYAEDRQSLGAAPAMGDALSLPLGWPEWSRRARDGEAFSIGLAVASDGPQAGPARVLSWSRGPFERNLTIAQDEYDLVVRVRSTVAGPNGESPACRVRRVFDPPGRVRQIQVTHARGVTRIVVDGVPHSFRATPFGAWMKPFQAVEAWELASLNVVGFALLLLPIAALAACWRLRRR